MVLLALGLKELLFRRLVLGMCLDGRVRQLERLVNQSSNLLGRRSHSCSPRIALTNVCSDLSSGKDLNMRALRWNSLAPRRMAEQDEGKGNTNACRKPDSLRNANHEPTSRIMEDEIETTILEYCI